MKKKTQRLVAAAVIALLIFSMLFTPLEISGR